LRGYGETCGADFGLQVESIRDPIENILNRMNRHPVRFPLGHKQRRILIPTMIQVPLKPYAGLRTKVHLSFFVFFPNGVHTAALPIHRTAVEFANLPHSTSRGEEEFHERMLQDTDAGIPKQFEFIDGECLWHTFAKLRLLQLHGRIAHEEILFHQPLDVKHL
jgi:hypothetical protein